MKETVYLSAVPLSMLYNLPVMKSQVDVVFIDFAMAVDLGNHSILLNKLYKYRIRGSLLDWCRDYLTNRRQRVVVKGDVSDWLTVTSDVPQGPLLGPLFL